MLVAYFELCGKLLPVIVDTGATISCVPEKGIIMDQFKLKVLPANLNVSLADNTSVHIDKKTLVTMRPKGSNKHPQSATFYVNNGVDNILGYQALVGLKTLKQFNLDIQFLNMKAEVFCEGKLISQEIPIDHELESSLKVDERYLSAASCPMITNMLKKYKSIFTDISQEPLHGVPMRILTTHNRPIFAKQKHYNADEIMQMKKHIKGLLDKGIIERTYSGYAATSRIIPKRNGSGRLVVNYIPLNSVTLRDSYVLPHAADIMGAIQGKKFFSTMDCAQGFYQILVDRRDRHKTAFSTPIGNYQFVRCPFGARNSCAVFQSEMNRIFLDGLYNRCVIYVDDILVFGNTREEHDENLQWVLDRCKQFNVKIKLEKCTFAQTEVDYLGFKVSGQSISPLKERVETLRKDKPPISKTDLRSVIGKLNFYSRFIPNYSKLLEPLRELFKKNKDFQWRPNHQKVYEQLLISLNDAPPQVLASRTTSKIIELHVMKDSLEVMCLTLEEQLICRASRFIGAAEANYSLVEKQLLALNLAISKFQLWLEPDNFTVRVPTKGIERAIALIDRPERVEKLLLRMPAGFDSFKFIVKENIESDVSKKFTTHIPQEIYYVDGACKLNGKPNCAASWAVVAEYDLDLQVAGMVDKSPSNQSAELTAAVRACEIAKERGQTEITIVTDSKYLHTAATNWIDKWRSNDWKDHRNKPVVNVDLFKELLMVKSGIQIEWIHVRGHTNCSGNIRADSLARSLLDEQAEVLNAMTTRSLRIQEDNPEISELKTRIRNQQCKDLIIENDMIYYVDPNDNINDIKRMYVPKCSRRWLLELAHDNQVFGGHLGIKKTASKLSRFWWPGMLKDVELYVKSCETCQAFKNRTGPTPGLLHSIPVSRIFHHVHLDIVGPTNASTIRGNRYIITATDAFSKYAFARPCQSIKTADVIKFVEECITATHGSPEIIITDRGSQFISAEWASYMGEASIKHQMTSSYHPQSNGIDERFNGTLVRILKSYVNEFQDDWDANVKWALYVYNTTIHSSTGFSPYHILHGLDPRTPFNSHLSANSSTNNLVRIRDLVRKEADGANKLSQEVQKRIYDRHRKTTNLNVGELVWVKEHSCPTELSRKFYPKWYGPCVILSLLGDNNNPRAVAILDCKYFIKKVVSIQDIKPHNDRPDHLKEKPKRSEEKGETRSSRCVEVPYASVEPTVSVSEPVDNNVPPSTQSITEGWSEQQQVSSPTSILDCTLEAPDSDRPSSPENRHELDHTRNRVPVASSPKRRVTFSETANTFRVPEESEITYCDTNESFTSAQTSEAIDEDERNTQAYTGDESEQGANDDTVEAEEQLISIDQEDNSAVPSNQRPWVMPFIIDNYTEDPTFDPADISATSTNEASRTISADENTNLSVESPQPMSESRIPTATHRYNLRPLKGLRDNNKQNLGAMRGFVSSLLTRLR